MYDGFYNLTNKPFQLNADPAFFFKSPIHLRALSYMRYGLVQKEGFIVVTGHPGTGKTMLVKELLRSLDGEQLITGIMVTSQVGAEDTLRIVSATFGLPYEGDDKSSLLVGIEKFVMQAGRDKKNILLVVDEAQNLPKQSLEELRMLSNFEMNGKSLFQTFLIGQPELGQTLYAPDMEQLRQRIVATYQLKGLNEEETKGYIIFRLEKAGWHNNPQFDDSVFELIAKHTEGIPRRINTFCDRLLLYGYLEELKLIDRAAVEKVIAEVKEEEPVSQSKRLVEAVSPVIENHSVNLNDVSLQERIQLLEAKVANLQIIINKERNLLRKALLIQLDMSDTFDVFSEPEDLG